MKVRSGKQAPARFSSIKHHGEQTVHTPRRRNTLKALLHVAIFCWPLLYLFDYVFPINGKFTGIGNDFIGLYYKYKVHLLAHLANFSFPFWSPSEAAGFPFYTNPFAQAFYPFNLLLAVWYKISGGYNPLDHQVFTVLGISIFALGLFMWLRLANSNIRAVIFAALVMSVSFKMTEIIRFPNAVHTAAWYPWVLYAMTKILLSRSIRNTIWAGLGLFFFLVCMCTGGYPYYLYYSQFLFGPYLLLFVIRPLRRRFFGPLEVSWKRALATLAVVAVALVVVCGPYLLGVKALMDQTTDRAGRDFDYSTKHVFSFEDTVGSLVYPPAAQTEGWYFFSITGVLIIFLYLLCGKTPPHVAAENSDDRKELALPPEPADLWMKGFLIAWIALITYISYGCSSYLFILLWKCLPGFSSLRVWGRINIILLPILAWLLSLAYNWFESAISDKGIPAVKKRWPHFLLSQKSWGLAAIVKLVAIYAVVRGAQLYFYRNKIYDPYWLWYFDHLSPLCIWFIFYGAAAFVIILLLLILGKLVPLRSARSLTAIVAVLAVIATIEMRTVGGHIWAFQDDVQKGRIHLDVAKINEASFQFARTDYKSTISLGPNFSVGILENWYFSRYVKFLKETENQLQMRKVLLGVNDGTKMFFSESIKHPTIQLFLQDAVKYRQPGRLLSYTGDELNWEVNAPVAGYLSFIDNWDPSWKAFVDDKSVEIELLFGTFKSVRLAPGLHRVRFSYQPRLFWALF